jgi:hypothetical protein
VLDGFGLEALGLVELEAECTGPWLLARNQILHRRCSY